MIERLHLDSPERVTPGVINYLEKTVPRITSLVEDLTKKGLLKRKNLSGRVVDAGTFTGAGVLALEKFRPKSIVGVDIAKVISDGTDAEAILGNRFLQQDIRSYLSSCEPNSLNLVAALNTNIPLYIYFDQLETVFVPGGQLLVTTDVPAMVNWRFDEKKGFVPISYEDWRELPDLHRPTLESFVRGSYADFQDKFVYIWTKDRLQDKLLHPMRFLNKRGK